MNRFAFLTILPLFLFSNPASSQSIELYVNQKTKQVFTEPGADRVRLGTFAPVMADTKVAQPVASSTVTQLTPSAPGESSTSVATPVSLSDVKPKKEWFEKLSIKGYTQLRYTSLWDRDGAKWNHPQDRSVSEDTTFIVRRARFSLSGDVSDHLYVYVQPELMASPVDGSDNSVQLRDAYGDVALDPAKEYRIRLGQSKIPYGFSNMQSSQNRAPFERADAIESAAEGNRDIGAFFYWAPDEIRKRFKKLTQDGLKGSGDYGVLGLGAYSGEGMNRADTNNSPHVVARLTYPFLFSDGQIFQSRARTT